MSKAKHPIRVVYKCKSKKEAFRILHLLEMIDRSPVEWEIIYWQGRAQTLELTY